MRSLSCGSSWLVPSGVVANTNDAGPSLVAKVWSGIANISAPWIKFVPSDPLNAILPSCWFVFTAPWVPCVLWFDLLNDIPPVYR